jgi:hypothetical protein
MGLIVDRSVDLSLLTELTFFLLMLFRLCLCGRQCLFKRMISVEDAIMFPRRPENTGELVGQANRRLIEVTSIGKVECPLAQGIQWLAALLFPSCRGQYGSWALNQQGAHMHVAAFAHAPECAR